MVKKIKNIFILVLTLALVFSFVGCSSGSGSTEESNSNNNAVNYVPPELIGSITISSYNAEYTAKDPYGNNENIEDDNDLFLFTQAYALQYPSVDVQLDALLNYNDYFETLDSRIESGEIGDVALISSSKLPEYVEKGWLVDLTSDANGVIDYTDSEFGKLYPENIYLKSAYEASCYEGRLYMCPVEYNNKVVILNIDMLAEAGIENPVPDDDWTWDQLIEYAEKLNANGVESPVLMNYTDYSIWGAFAMGFGEKLYNEVNFADKTTELNITDPDVIEGFRYFADNFLRTGFVDTKNTTETVKGEDISKYGIIVCDHADVVRWNAALSLEKNSADYFDWEFAHFPGFEAEDGTICKNIGVDTLGFAVINKDAINADETENEESSEEEATDKIKIAKSLALYAMVEEAAIQYAGEEGFKIPALIDVNSKKFWREYPISGKNTAVFSLYSEFDYPAVLTSFMNWDASVEIRDTIADIFKVYAEDATITHIDDLLQVLQDAANAAS